MVILEEQSTELELIEEPVVKKATLDQFWKLGQARNEKNRLDAASKVLQAVARSEVEAVYTVTRLVKGLAGSSNDARQGYFVCLTELLRQSEVEYKTVAKQVQANLKIGGTLTKGESADFLVAQLLAYSAMLRAGVVQEGDREEVVRELLEISGARRYLLLPVIKLLIEHFLGKGDADIVSIITSSISIKIADLNIDSLYLLLSIHKLDQALITEQFLEEVGVKKLFGKKALEAFSSCLLTASLPPGVVAEHPTLAILINILVEKEVMLKFWQVMGPEMTAANSKGVVGWTVLREVGRLAGAVGMLPDMLTRHSLSVGLQLASRQASVGMVKDVLTMVVAGVEMAKMDRLGMIKRLIDMDLCWDKLPVGGTVSQLLMKADMETVKEVAKVYMTNLKGEGKMVERVHSASMLVKLVGLSAMQCELEWRREMLEALASVSVVGGVVGVGVLNSSGRDQMKDVLFRALDSRNKNLEDSVVLLVGLVKYIKEQLNKEATRVKSLDSDQDAVAKKVLGVIDKLEKKWAKGKGKEVGVFLFLYCQMWLQMFSQPDLATEVLGELAPVYDRWSKGDKKGSEAAEEPAWVEVVTEILISLLAQNNHLLRGVVGAVFSVVGREMTAPAMGSLLAVIKQKDGVDDEEEEDDDDGEELEEDGDEGEEEDGNDKDSSEDEESSDDDDEEEKNVDPALLTKLSGALGDHADDSESDIDMDEVPDEDMAKLDEKLAEAFKALGGRKDGLGKKKAALSSLASMHFKLRVLELVDLYLTHSPNPAHLPTIVPALLESLDKAVRSGSAEEPLVKRLVSALAKVASVKIKVEGTVSSEVGEEVVQVLSSLMELASSGSVVVNTLGPTFPRLATSLLRLGEQCGRMGELQALYNTSLSAWLHQSTCVLPNNIFSLAMSHSWPGCWSLATTLATSSFSPEVRQFRRVASLALLSSLLHNKVLVKDNLEEVKVVVEQLIPALSKDLEKLKDMMGKVKPKYLCEMFSILQAVKDIPSDKLIDWDLVVEKLQSLAQAWPANKIYNPAKLALLKLGGKCGVKIEVTKNIEVVAANGETNGEEKSSKKKKRKHKKSQESLKKAKEMKLEMVKAQDNSGVPSFAAMVEDNINIEESTESTEIKKRKLNDGEENETPLKVKKSKKKKEVDTETPVKIKKTKKKKPQE